MSSLSKNQQRLKRKVRIRKKISGTADRPRMCVFRSLKNVYVQVIDDVSGVTLVGVSSQNKEIKAKQLNGVKLAAHIGDVVGQKCVEKNITEIVFDKSGYKYHGRVKAVAESARKQGIKF